MAHLLAPTSSSKLDFVVARQFKEAVDVFGQRRKRWRSQLRLQPRKMLENAKLLPECCGQGRSCKKCQRHGERRPRNLHADDRRQCACRSKNVALEALPFFSGMAVTADGGELRHWVSGN